MLKNDIDIDHNDPFDSPFGSKGLSDADIAQHEKFLETQSVGDLARRMRLPSKEEWNQATRLSTGSSNEFSDIGTRLQEYSEQSGQHIYILKKADADYMERHAAVEALETLYKRPWTAYQAWVERKNDSGYDYKAKVNTKRNIEKVHGLRNRLIEIGQVLPVLKKKLSQERARVMSSTQASGSQQRVRGSSFDETGPQAAQTRGSPQIKRGF